MYVTRKGYLPDLRPGKRGASILAHLSLTSREECLAELRPEDARFCLAQNASAPDGRSVVEPAVMEPLRHYLNSPRCGALCDAGPPAATKGLAALYPVP